MIKWLINGDCGTTRMRRWFCLPNPEHLNTLTERVRGAEHPRTVALSEEFSAMVSSIWVNGTQKLTARQRLPETTRACGRYLESMGREPIEFLDIGASDGAATLEAVNLLGQQTGATICATALDRYTRLVRHDWGPVSEYRTADGSPVLIRLGPLAMRLARPLMIPMAEWFRRFYIRQDGFRRRMKMAEDISLIHPFAASATSVEVVEADAMQRQEQWLDRFDLVRASNFLNHSYFSHGQMRQVISHVHAYLKDGGLFVASRNVGYGSAAVECGSLWRKRDDSFEFIERFNGGSDVEELVTSYQPNVDQTPSSDRAAA